MTKVQKPMPLPNFLCVGAQKAGTTTLHMILKQHPDIYLPSVKEVHFFGDDRNFNRGLAWYHQFAFAGVRGEKAVGEITPEYLLLDYVPERILNALGRDIKLIFIFRNPADRAYSNYLMHFSAGRDTEPFMRALELEDERIKNRYRGKVMYSYLHRGYYADQVKRYLEFFPRENMLFLVFEEDIIRNLEQGVRKIYSHLGVEQVGFDPRTRSNVSGVPHNEMVRFFYHGIIKLRDVFAPAVDWLMWRISMGFKDRIRSVILKKALPLEPEVRRTLLERYFRDDIRELEGIIERPLQKIWIQE